MFVEEVAAEAFRQVVMWNGSSPTGTHEYENSNQNNCGEFFHPPYFDYMPPTHSVHNHNLVHLDTAVWNHSKEGEYFGIAVGGGLEHRDD